MTKQIIERAVAPIQEEDREPSAVELMQPPQAVVLTDVSTPAKLALALEQTRNLMEYKAEVLKLAISQARPQDVENHDGPYFRAYFCRRMLGMLGAGQTQVLSPPKRVDEPDGHFSYWCIVGVTHPAFGTFTGYGSAHSMDKFLGTNADAWKEKANGRGRRLEEVSRHNIAQHAITRAEGSALRKMLGLSGLTWDDLKGLGFNPGGARQVDYNAGQRREGRRATGLAAKLWAGMKAKAIEIPGVAKFAEEELGYTGKLKEAPDEVLAQLISAMDAGVLG